MSNFYPSLVFASKALMKLLLFFNYYSIMESSKAAFYRPCFFYSIIVAIFILQLPCMVNYYASLFGAESPVCIFLNTLIQAISITPLQVLYYSEALPTQHGYCARISCRSATGSCE